ncbi:type II secretion system protein [Desulfovulcanus sp.]
MKKNYGFTLIEMAIVLVIIGLILAAVMKGKDMIRSTQAKEFTEGFVYKWVNIAQSFKDKTGHVLTDSVQYGGLNSTTDGYMDNVLPVASSSPDSSKGEIAGSDIVDVLKSNGIDPCRLIKTDIQSNSTDTIDYCNGMDIFRRTVKGEYTTETVQVYFMNAENGKLADNSYLKYKNVLVFSPVPADVAKAIDKQIDGREDGRMGNVLGVSTGALLPPDAQTTLKVTLSSTSRFTRDWDDLAPSPASGDTVNVVILLEQ